MKGLKSKLNKYKYFLVILISFILILQGTPLFPNLEGAVFIDEILGTMSIDPKTVSINMKNSVVLPDVGNRAYTIDEIFNMNANSYSIPRGQHKEGFLFSENKAISKVIPNLDTKIEGRLEDHGNSFWRITDEAKVFLNNIFTKLSYTTSNLIKNFSSTLFDSKFICPDPEHPTSGCINLTGIIGGKDKQEGGIMGKLTSGLFFPLAIMSFLFVSGYMIYNGVIKRQYRVALQGLGWALGVYLLGIVILMYPWFISRLPNTINSYMVGCLISSFNGESCGADTEAKKDLNFDNVSDKTCVAQSKNKLDANDKLQLSLANMNCIISKGFTIERWAEYQFGYSFNELYTKDPPKGYQAYPKNKLVGVSETNPEDDFCVNMYSEYSPNELSKMEHPVFTNEKQVCNIALAYMSNRTIGDFGTKAKMEHIIATAANDNKMWGAFTGAIRDSFGIFSFLSVIAASISFIPISIMGHVYSFTSTILIVFAPVFILMGIYPGEGRKVMLGWLESTVSYILKFIATALLVIIMIFILTSISANLNGFLTLIVNIILSITFIMQRKELTELVGKVSLGGEKLKNHAETILNKGLDISKATAAGKIGGGLAAMKDAENPKDALKKFYEGQKAGGRKALMTELSRGSGFMAQAVRSGGKVSRDLQAKRDDLERRMQEESRRQDSLNELRNLANEMKESVNNQSQQFQENTQKQEETIKSFNLNSATTAVTTQLATTDSEIIRDKLSGEIENLEKSDDVKKRLSEFTLDFMNEAKILDNSLKQNDKSGKEQVKDYTYKFEDNFFNKITSGIEHIKTQEDFKNLSQEQQSFIIDTFTSEQLDILSKVSLELEKGFSIKGEGKNSFIEDVNIEKQIQTKKELDIIFKENLNNYMKILDKYNQNDFYEEDYIFYSDDDIETDFIFSSQEEIREEYDDFYQDYYNE